jgi:hypothetical protein
MDDDGWVHISVPAGFNRVRQLTADPGALAAALAGSQVVEVRGWEGVVC